MELIRQSTPLDFKDDNFRIIVVLDEHENARHQPMQGISLIEFMITPDNDAGFISSEYPVAHQVFDLFTAVHEIAHSAYNVLNNSGADVPNEVYKRSADRALSEGFSCLTELLAVEHLFSTCRHPRISMELKKYIYAREIKIGKMPLYMHGLDYFRSIYHEFGWQGVLAKTRDINREKAMQAAYPSKEYFSFLTEPVLTDLLGTTHSTQQSQESQQQYQRPASLQSSL